MNKKNKEEKSAEKILCAKKIKRNDLEVELHLEMLQK